MTIKRLLLAAMACALVATGPAMAEVAQYKGSKVLDTGVTVQGPVDVSSSTPFPTTCISGCAAPTAYTPTGAATLSVSTSSSRVALPSADTTVLLTNNGTNDVSFKFGNSSVTAATTDYLLPVGRSIVVSAGSSTYVAAITATSTSTLSITTGTGTPTISGGGNSTATLEGLVGTTNTSLSTLNTNFGATGDAASTSGSGTAIALLKALRDQALSATATAVKPQAQTTGGCTPYGFTSAATTNSTLISTGQHTLCALTAINTTATLYYLRVYDAAAAPTCSSATGFKFSLPIPASATGAGAAVPLGPFGLDFASGLGFCLTGGGSSTDNTSAATGVYLVGGYK